MRELIKIIWAGMTLASAVAVAFMLPHEHGFVQEWLTGWAVGVIIMTVIYELRK